MGKIKEFFKNHFHLKNKYQEWKARRLEKNQLKMQSDEMLDLTSKLDNHRKKILIRYGTILGILAVLVIGYSIYNHFRVFHAYTKVSSEKREDIASTKYIQFGDNYLKYSPDGVSCINGKNEVLWSSTFSMQSPIVDLCGTTAAIGDQKGTQVYLFDETGEIGKFETTLPLLKVRVASQGVVSVILEESDITWINFYNTNGDIIAKNRTSISDSGYPMDVDLSPDGLKMMVSYLKVQQEKMSTKIAFYNFSSLGQTQLNNEVSSITYDNTVVPRVVYLNDSTAAAYRNDGITIFSGNQIPEEKAKLDLTQEIVSIFYSDEYLGAVMKSDDTTHKYLMQLFNKNGRVVMKKYLDMEYTDVKLDGSQILISNQERFMILTTGGKEVFSGKYEKPIMAFMRTGGFRKYTVVTQNSTDQIRLK